MDKWISTSETACRICHSKDCYCNDAMIDRFLDGFGWLDLADGRPGTPSSSINQRFSFRPGGRVKPKPSLSQRDKAAKIRYYNPAK